MGAFIELVKYFSTGIVNKAIELNYSPENILVLSGEETKFRQMFPKVWDNLVSCRHSRDRRTPFEYGRDLVASWVFEDCLIKTLQESGLDIRHTGADKDRCILSSTDVTTYSDATIYIGNNTIPLEIICDYTGFCLNNKRIGLRDNKYLKLKNSNSLLLNISTADNKMIILDCSKDLPVEYIQHYTPFGGKPIYSIHITDKDVYPFELDILVEEIKHKLYAGNL
jgi:hypothetical protein